MLRSAEDIRQEVPIDRQPPEYSANQAEWMINEARKEAIEECAKRATLVDNGVYIVPSNQVDKQSILSLINELK